MSSQILVTGREEFMTQARRVWVFRGMHCREPMGESSHLRSVLSSAFAFICRKNRPRALTFFIVRCGG